MVPEQRAAAWTTIEAQLAAASTASQANAAVAPETTTTTVTTAGSATMPQTSTVLTSTGNWTPPPPETMAKTYPICTSKLQDSCQNPGEGGAKGRSRALNYWPGKPASEGGK